MTLRYYRVKKESTFHLVLRLRGNGNSLKNDVGLPIADFEPKNQKYIAADTIFKVTFPVSKTKTIGVMTSLKRDRSDVIIKEGCITVTYNGIPIPGREVISKNQIAFIPDSILTPSATYEVRVNPRKVSNDSGIMLDEYETDAPNMKIKCYAEYTVMSEQPMPLTIKFYNIQNNIAHAFNIILPRKTNNFLAELEMIVKAYLNHNINFFEHDNMYFEERTTVAGIETVTILKDSKDVCRITSPSIYACIPKDDKTKVTLYKDDPLQNDVMETPSSYNLRPRTSKRRK